MFHFECVRLESILHLCIDFVDAFQKVKRPVLERRDLTTFLQKVGHKLFGPQRVSIMRAGSESCAVLTDVATLADFECWTHVLKSLDGDADHSLSYDEFGNVALPILYPLLKLHKDILQHSARGNLDAPRPHHSNHFKLAKLFLEGL